MYNVRTMFPLVVTCMHIQCSYTKYTCIHVQHVHECIIQCPAYRSCREGFRAKFKDYIYMYTCTGDSLAQLSNIDKTAYVLGTCALGFLRHTSGLFLRVLWHTCQLTHTQ